MQSISAVARSLWRNYCLLLAFFLILNKAKVTVRHHGDHQVVLKISYKLWQFLFWVNPNHHLYKEFHWLIISWRSCRCKSKYLFCHSKDTIFFLVLQESRSFCRQFMVGAHRCLFCRKSMFCRNQDWLSDWLEWYLPVGERIWRNKEAIEGWIAWRCSWLRLELTSR